MLHVVPTNWYSWNFRVTDESRAVADITLSNWCEKGAFTRKAAASLPHDLPLPVRMFIVWVTMISWRREQSACSSC